MSEFKGQEKEVMLLLCKKYKVDPNTIDGLNSYTAPTPVSEAATTAPAEIQETENDEAEKVKEEVEAKETSADTDNEVTADNADGNLPDEAKNEAKSEKDDSKDKKKKK